MPRAPLRRRQPNRNGALPHSRQTIPNSTPVRRELEKKLAHKPVAQRPNDSDDSDRLVVKGNGRRGRNVQKQEIYASGGVGKGDKPGAHPTRAQRRKSLVQATKEVLAKAQQDAPASMSSESVRPAQRSLLANCHADKVTQAQRQEPGRAAISSSAVKAPASIPRSVQHTPTRETSILGTLKPRRRQPSILQALEPDSSSFDLDDEEQFLPDMESTPTEPSTALNVSSTPATNLSLSSSSKKRKFGSTDKPQPDIVEKIPKATSKPAASSPRSEETREPSLPPVAASAPRNSRSRSREKVHEDDDDIMALPRSSSSLLLSPVRAMTPAAAKNRKKKAPKPAPTMATEELQTLMMPRKKRRTARARTITPGEFDIAADSDSHDSEQFDLPNEEDDPSFLPTNKGRNSRRKAPVLKAMDAEGKSGRGSKPGGGAEQRSSAAARTSKSNTSTRHLRATQMPVLAPSTPTSTRINHSTKSPSQLSTVNTSDLNLKQADTRQRTKQGKARHPGGSPHEGQDPIDGADKENLDVRHGSLDESGAENLDTSHENTAETSRGKWADIDAWDLDFEEVEATSASSGSSPLRR